MILTTLSRRFANSTPLGGTHHRAAALGGTAWGAISGETAEVFDEDPRVGRITPEGARAS